MRKAERRTRLRVLPRPTKLLTSVARSTFSRTLPNQATSKRTQDTPSSQLNAAP